MPILRAVVWFARMAVAVPLERLAEVAAHCGLEVAALRLAIAAIEIAPGVPLEEYVRPDHCRK